MSTANFNQRSEVLTIFSGAIFSDPAYQRLLDMKRVNKIVAEFKQELVNFPKVSFRDGKYYVFDGQHTLAALKMRNDEKDLPVKCLVFYGLSQKDEAVLFARQSGNSKEVASACRMKALYFAGDPDVVKFREATERTGLIMDFTCNMGIKHLVACTKAKRCYDRMIPEDYVDMLNIILEAWGGTAESLRAEIIGGMFEFYRAFRKKFKRGVLVDRLAMVQPMAIIRDGKIVTRGGDKRFALKIVQIYNKGVRGNKLSEMVFVI